MTDNTHPEALRLANILRGIDARSHFANESLSSASAALENQHARITELESQLAQRFDAADMATAAAQGFRDGVASLTAQAADSQPAQVMGDTPPPCDQELFDQGVSVGLFDIPKWTAEALCRGIAAATEARVDWHYIGGRVHIKALPAARAPADIVQAGEYPALVCDYCGALTPDPWHSSGMLHGKMSKHIHSCDACAGGETTGATDMTTQQPDALQCAADLEYSIAHHGMQDAFTLNAYSAMKMVRTQQARITELESQLAQRFGAADMATASAQGFRDGVASLSAMRCYAASKLGSEIEVPEELT